MKEHRNRLFFFPTVTSIKEGCIKETAFKPHLEILNERWRGQRHLGVGKIGEGAWETDGLDYCCASWMFAEESPQHWAGNLGPSQRYATGQPRWFNVGALWGCFPQIPQFWEAIRSHQAVMRDHIQALHMQGMHPCPWSLWKFLYFLGFDKPKNPWRDSHTGRCPKFLPAIRVKLQVWSLMPPICKVLACFAIWAPCPSFWPTAARCGVIPPPLSPQEQPKGGRKGEFKEILEYLDKIANSWARAREVYSTEG